MSDDEKHALCLKIADDLFKSLWSKAIDRYFNGPGPNDPIISFEELCALPPYQGIKKETP